MRPQCWQIKEYSNAIERKSLMFKIVRLACCDNKKWTKTKNKQLLSVHGRSYVFVRYVLHVSA